MVETVMGNDPKIISGLYGENEGWQIVLDARINKIEAYIEDGDIPWFAVYEDNKIIKRINSRYVESVVYL